MSLGIGTGIGLQRFFIGSGGGGNNTPAQYGGIFSNDFTTLANLNNYTANTPASTWQLTGGYLRVTQVPGAASFNDWLRYNAWGDTQLEDYTLTTRFIPRDILTGNSGIGIGIKSTNTFGATQNVYAIMRTDSTASGGKVIIYFDGTNKSISSAITWTTGDTIEVKLHRNKFSYTGSVQNITSGSTIQTCVWNSDFTGSNDSQRIGRPALIHLGGTHDVISMSYNASTYKYATFAFIGDSITHGNNSLIDTNNTWRFANIATMGLDPNLTTVYASSNNTTQEIINNLPEITSFRPTNVVLMIGGNDVELSVAMNTYRNNYTTIRNSLVASGATVFHCLATPRNATNMTILNNWILSSFTSDTIINTYNTIVSGAGTGILAKYNADGTHPNWLGHVRLGQTIYSAISSAYTYSYDNNSTSLFNRLTVSLNTANRFNYDFLMRKLTSESIYSELEFLRVFSQANATDALLNLVSTSFTATISGSPTFSAFTHYSFNGTTDAIDTGFNVLNGTKLLQNSASLGVYVRGNGTSGEGCDLGAFQSTSSRTHIFARYTTGTKMSLAPNSTAPTDDNTKGPGFYQTKRVTSGATTHSVRANTVNYSASSSDVSVTRPNVTLSIGARNRQSGGAINFSDRPVAAAYAGSGNIDMEKMFKIVHGFMNLNNNVDV